MIIFFILLTTSMLLVRPNEPNPTQHFLTQLKQVEIHQKKFQLTEDELERYYSLERLSENLNSFYLLCNTVDTLKQLIGILQTNDDQIIAEILPAITQSTITPLLKKELATLIFDKYENRIIGRTRTMLQTLILYDDSAFEEAWINAMIAQAP